MSIYIVKKRNAQGIMHENGTVTPIDTYDEAVELAEKYAAKYDSEYIVFQAMSSSKPLQPPVVTTKFED